MTRHVVAYEGKKSIDGLLIQPGALRVIKDNIPVTPAFDYTQLIGSASDFQRNEETGELSMEIETEYELTDLNATIAISDVVLDGKNVVAEGVIVQVAFLTGPKLWV
jgi:hypothetical protein